MLRERMWMLFGHILLVELFDDVFLSLPPIYLSYHVHIDRLLGLLEKKVMFLFASEWYS
jgi:hypothetical protein